MVLGFVGWGSFSNAGGVDFSLVTDSEHLSSVNGKQVDSRAYLSYVEEVLVSKDRKPSPSADVSNMRKEWKEWTQEPRKT